MKKVFMAVLVLLTFLTACSKDKVTESLQNPNAKYTVSFDSLGGITVSAITVGADNLVTEPIAPTKDGFLFAGWSKDKTATNRWNFGTDKIKGDMTLFALWSRKAKSLATGDEYYTMIVAEDGTLWATGNNKNGQLGTGNNTSVNTPVQIDMKGKKVASVSTGSEHTMIVTTDGELWATGLNNKGQLGTGNNTSVNTPVQIDMKGKKVASVSAGAQHTMIVTTDGELWATGRNDLGQLGTKDYTDVNAPVKITIDKYMPKKADSVSAGYGHTLVLTDSSMFYSTGFNVNNQLGLGSHITDQKKSEFEPVISGVKSVSVWSNHTFIIKNDDSLSAVGNNTDGQLGTGDKYAVMNFRKVTDSVLNVATNSRGTMIVKKDGSLWATGTTQYLDGNQSGSSDSFKKIMEDVLSVDMGSNHTMIIKKDGSLWASGNNIYGQLGTGNTTNEGKAKQVVF